MKKFILILLSVLASCNLYFAQVTLYTSAPPDDGGTSSNRGPNGTSAHSYMRGCFLVLQSELTNIAPNTVITSFGFTLSSGTNLTAVPGNFTLYVENTSDATYSHGTAYSGAITTMTNVYTGSMTVPTTASSTSITVTLSTPFTYTGGGIYVAYDWTSTGPFDLAAAVYHCNYQGLTIGGATAASGSSAPATLANTNFRPSFLWGTANPYSNDVAVTGIEAPGRINVTFNTPHSIKALIRNSSSALLSNINVNLDVSGANTFLNSQTIPTLAAGAETTVTFAAFNPLNLGLNTLSVSVVSDQNNVNNSSVYSQSITCNEWAQNPATGNYTAGVGFATGTGIIASTFLNPVASSLTGLRAAVANNTINPGNAVYGVLLSASGAILATTNTVTISTPMLGTWQVFNFPAPQNLAANTTYYLGFAQLVSAIYPMGAIPAPYIPATYYAFTALTGGAMTPLLQNLGYLGMEAIFQPDLVSVVATPSSVCYGATATLSLQGIATGYTWNPGGATSTSISVSPATSTTYSLNTSYLSCSATTTVLVNIIQLPNVTAVANYSAICIGGSVTLTAGGAGTYSWNTGPVTNTLSDSPLVNTTYTVTGVSSAGCVNTGTVEVIVNSFTPGITSPTAICTGEQIQVMSTGGTGNTYTWSSGLNGFSDITVSPTLTTVYTVTAIGSTGCKGTNATTITVNPVPSVTASAQRTIMCKGESNKLTATGADIYSWANPASTSSMVTISPTIVSTVNYTVTGTNSVGCTNTTVISVKVNACSGLEEQNVFQSTVRVFPNPGSGLVNVLFENPETETFIEIRNPLGALVKKQTVDAAEMQLDIQQEADGIYFIHIIRGGKAVYVSKIVKR